MKIDIYKINKKENHFISVPANSNLETLNLLQNIKIEDLHLFKKDLVLQDGIICLDHKNIIKEISNNGYAIHAASIFISEI